MGYVKGVTDGGNARASVQVILPLGQDHGAQFEAPWAQALGQNRYKLLNIPFYYYGLSLDDVIEALPRPDDERPYLTKVLEKSGNRTLRIMMKEAVTASHDSLAVLASLKEIGCRFEGDGKRFFAINVPPHCDLDQLCRFLTERNVRWENADPPKLHS